MTIKMIAYSQPLKYRLEMRKVCGPYEWTPAEAGNGRGFYQAENGLACSPRGSTFDLRLELANDHLTDWGYGSLKRINGYYADEHCDTTLTPIIARLPHSKGFLAGWTMGRGMAASLDAAIYDSTEEAARAAHSDAEYAAERERDYQATQTETTE